MKDLEETLEYLNFLKYDLKYDWFDIFREFRSEWTISPDVNSLAPFQQTRCQLYRDHTKGVFLLEFYSKPKSRRYEQNWKDEIIEKFYFMEDGKILRSKPTIYNEKETEHSIDHNTMIKILSINCSDIGFVRYINELTSQMLEFINTMKPLYEKVRIFHDTFNPYVIKSEIESTGKPFKAKLIHGDDTLHITIKLTDETNGNTNTKMDYEIKFLPEIGGKMLHHAAKTFYMCDHHNYYRKLGYEAFKRISIKEIVEDFKYFPMKYFAIESLRCLDILL